MPVQRFKNRLIQVKKAHTDPTASFTTLVDLGENFLYTHFTAVNGFDEPVILRFTAIDNSTHEFELVAPEAWGLDDFHHNGIVEYKYKTDAPTTGGFTFVSW